MLVKRYFKKTGVYDRAMSVMHFSAATLRDVTESKSMELTGNNTFK